MFIRIGNIIVNTSAIASINLEAKLPQWGACANTFDTNHETGVEIRLVATQGSFGYGDTGCGEVQPVTHFFTGLAAEELRRWFSKALHVETIVLPYELDNEKADRLAHERDQMVAEQEVLASTLGTTDDLAF